jgi:hypothetical protein
MKHRYLAPLCSALILPGVGQIINRQMIKGLILIGLTTLILLVAIIKLALDLSAAMNQAFSTDMGGAGGGRIMEALRQRDMTWLWIMLGSGLVVWGYSVADAFIHGKKRETDTGEGA